jgi:hypothetical protein
LKQNTGLALELGMPGTDGLQVPGHGPGRRDPGVGRGCPTCRELSDAFHE